MISKLSKSEPDAKRGVKARRSRRLQTNQLVIFLNDVMRRRRVLPSQLAAHLGVSHATVGRWLSGKDLPGVSSCQQLAEYSGESITRILSIVGHLPKTLENVAFELPDFREYARQKYPNELDEDLITMIEDLIERRRRKCTLPLVERTG